jgi:hypothetical protein
MAGRVGRLKARVLVFGEAENDDSRRRSRQSGFPVAGKRGVAEAFPFVPPAAYHGGIETGRRIVGADDIVWADYIVHCFAPFQAADGGQLELPRELAPVPGTCRNGVSTERFAPAVQNAHADTTVPCDIGHGAF